MKNGHAPVKVRAREYTEIRRPYLAFSPQVQASQQPPLQQLPPVPQQLSQPQEQPQQQVEPPQQPPEDDSAAGTAVGEPKPRSARKETAKNERDMSSPMP
jgi:hypothetical protein